MTPDDEPPRTAHKPLRSSAPPHSILNAGRRYVPAAETDLRATFDRIRREQQNKADRLALWKNERKSK